MTTHKKIIISALWAVILTACGGSKKEVLSEFDSVLEEVELLTDSVVRKPMAYITKDSVGVIKIGMSINNVPDYAPDLYDKKLDGASEDAVTVTFSDSDGEKFIGYDFGEGKIDVINVIGKDVKVKAPKGEFGIGDKFAKVLELPGVTAKWSGYDGGGSWYWVWEGLWFAPSQDTLTETLSRRLYYSGSAPTVVDFNDDITIGFIGTGLPF
ncbi:MAG: hypothetical protein HDR88_16055 [Bacteroides sp.]|nr:hypothetical protein [Bacteroides sp.]